MMIQRKFYVLGLLLVILVLIAGCAAPHLDEAKKQYEMALRAADPVPHYKAALEELDAAIARDSSQLQAYALKGLIYRNLEDFERATENLEIAKTGIGSFGQQLQWLPVVINLTYGEIFHYKAGDAIREGKWEEAKGLQDAALGFFDNVIDTSFKNLGTASEGDELGPSMEELHIKSQQRWAAGKFQMAVIASRAESKERQSELLREVTTRLSGLVQRYPGATALRYYLADGYYKQALTIRRAQPEEGEKLQEKAMAELQVCAEIGLSSDLRYPAADLVRKVSKGAAQELEMKILGTTP